jgi:ATP-dependent protease ClpP protease subunit
MDIDKLKTFASKCALPEGVPMAAKKDSAGTVYLYQEISAPEYGGISAKMFTDELKALGNVTTLDIRINSIGGSVIEALGIYNTLLAHPAKTKTVYIDGIAASAASFIAMAGTKIVMAESAQLMVHSPWIMASGNAKDLRNMADMLDRNTTILVGIYAKRTKLPADTLTAMLDAETWLTATEAVAQGFADEVAGSPAAEKMAAKLPDILTAAVVTQRQISEADLAIAAMEMALMSSKV